MRKYILLIAILASISSSSEVEITSKKFFADERAQKAEFVGNVVVTKESDVFKADRVLVDFNSKNEPIKYTAIGNIDANITINEKRYKGRGKNFVYEPEKSLYILTGDAFIHEIETDKKVYGEKIEVDQITGRYKVDSNDSAPVRFIFKTEEKK